ncbi:GIY-YIG nuclease family protein [Roseibium litorale]|uniref:GIY-YIG nuclease family protein n=1 Tax=Roseibium litorale TaxID=2803841 RepID=A0ABR9CJH6_9HYPH|nr:GIY-YIG nuclease family protein [Roseibium litorale]MBD8890987.1 GIY-YIG nuclease family protein [Roseibium litorale]
MGQDEYKQEIIRKIRDIASRNDGRAPGREKFQSETGIRPHEWRGKIWRTWSDAIVEAGLEPNDLQSAYSDKDLLRFVFEVASDLKRFPSYADLDFEARRRANAPTMKTIQARWKMVDLANALVGYAESLRAEDVASLAKGYVPPRRAEASNDDVSTSDPLGYVYMQRHGLDYKIGLTNSLNRRGRQIQIELPQEIELVHSILTDDPAGIEAYWHKRFAAKRTRGEWFKLSKAEVAAFKRWSKIW